MRIRNPPKFIMSTSIIMSLIMTLLVFQCGLVRNPFGDEGLAALVAPPPLTGAPPTTTGVLPKLKMLGLDHTQVSDAGCATLAAALDRGALQALNNLSLKGSPASATATAAVQEALAKRAN